MQWASALAAYMLGCIPSGPLVARSYGVDLASVGSGNVGATNALRALGKTAGAIVLAADMAKGAAAVFLAMKFAGQDAAYIAAGAAVMGHDFPVFRGFKGGKGVATSFGALLALAPPVAFACICVWLATVLIWRYSSLGALVSFAAMPAVAWLYTKTTGGLFTLCVFLAALVYVKHRSNIARLRKGREAGIGRKAG